MWVKRITIMLAFLLFCGSAKAQNNGLTTLHHYTVAAYQLLSMDTSGTALIPTATMQRFVRTAVNQMPTFVKGKELVKQAIITSSAQNVYVDSLVLSIKTVVKTDNDSNYVLRQRPFSLMKADFSEGVESADDKDAEYFAYFADTLYIYPSHVSSDADTLMIQYYQIPTFSDTTATGTIVMERPYQWGVVLFAVYQAELRLHRGLADAALARYAAWLKPFTENVVGRPVDLLGAEKQ